jgi:lipoprotein signal peptidase
MPKLSKFRSILPGVIRASVVLLGAATFVALVDLAHKAHSTSAVLVHDRSTLYLAGGLATSVVWAGLITLTRSSSIALASGVLLGGVAGNLLSVALWRGVPDPVVAGGLAFNLGDAAVALGVVLLIPAALAFAARNRERLFDPV